MTRYKKYLQEKGHKLETDYPYLPIDINGTTLEGVRTATNSNGVCVMYDYVVGTLIMRIDRNGNNTTDFV